MPGTKPTAILLSLLAIASLAVTGVAMTWYAQSSDVLLSWWSLWIFGPALLVLALAWRAAARFGSIAVLRILALALAFGPIVYVRGALPPVDAQAGLVFLFAPFWQFVGIGVALLLAFVLPRFARPRAGPS
jgi:hypothetical protein